MKLQENKLQPVSVVNTLILLVGTITLLVTFAGLGWWFWGEHQTTDTEKFNHLLRACGIAWVLIVVVSMLGFITVTLFVKDKVTEPEPGPPLAAPVSKQFDYDELGARLHRRYGRLWGFRVRILLVMGEVEQVEAIAPGLTAGHWLEGHWTLLVYGGSLQAEPDAAQLAALRRLRRFRPLNGVVWAMTEAQSAQPVLMDNALRMLQKQARQLRWQAPVYLWQVCHSIWSQEDRITQPVGCFFPERCTPEGVAEQLQRLIDPMRRQGMQQLLAKNAHDFLYRLSSTLENKGITHWRDVLTPVLKEYADVVVLRGLMFSLPVRVNQDGAPQSWLPDPVWQGVLRDSRRAPGRRLGVSHRQNLYYALMALALLWGAGSVLSFFTNRDQIRGVQAAVTDLKTHPVGSEGELMALKTLRNDMGRLQSRVEHGAPWYQRFGLNQNETLLTRVMPDYTVMNNRLIRDKAAAVLQAKLRALVNLPPNSPLWAGRLAAGHDLLKAYLMMARPEKAEAVFLTRVLSDNEPARAGIAPGVWLSAASDLWDFYAQNLSAHLDWRITPDTELVRQVRQKLLTQLGRRNADATLYQQMLQSVAKDYADVTLQQMTGDTEAERLLTTDKVVPGMFTRQAWEGQIQPAIDKAVASRREAIDWVLSDTRQAVSAAVSPAELKARLTERYLTDFAGAWQTFLNSLRWNKADNMAEVTDQLTLMADTRQSPLIALMNTVAYQGQTGQRGPALSDRLVKSVNTRLNNKTGPMIAPSAESGGPMNETFGPLLALMGENQGSGGVKADSRLNLHTFLTRVTEVRLKLQQMTRSDDPPAMANAQARAVFAGKSTDLTETQGYGRLIAASLGGQWQGLGQTLFVQPLTQAWQGVLKPAAADLNTQWQRAIVDNWNSAFAGRYPFAGGESDVSLPMLGQFIRSDSGRIEQFLNRQLGGILHKEGNRWVPDSVNSQGLPVNPAFLKAVNQLSQLSDVLFAEGSQGLRFELRARAVRDVVETDLTIDGQKLRYFNQMESWQSFRWPGETYRPGVMLTWTSVNAGSRLFGDYEGNWGLVRWLEGAKAERLDESRYRLTFVAPDGLPLTWILRTEVGGGPLALLKLRGFTLPKEIFVEAPGDDTSAPVMDEDGEAE